MDQKQIDLLIAKSKEVMEHAYCPYSGFPVGAALLCQDGSIVTGKLFPHRELIPRLE